MLKAGDLAFDKDKGINVQVLERLDVYNGPVNSDQY